MENLRRYNWMILSGQVILNLFLAWMLLSTANVLFLLPFPYKEGLPLFLLVAALGLTGSCISGPLYLYRRQRRLAIPGILNIPPGRIWCLTSLALAVILGICVAAYPNQWTSY